jgi:hypothetical protein
MRRRWVVVIVALAGVMVAKSIFIPNKMLVETGLAIKNVTGAGLHFSRPTDLKTFPADELPQP